MNRVDAADRKSLYFSLAAFAFRRAAQYFRIRSPTAFLCAADIGFRVRRGGVAASEDCETGAD